MGASASKGARAAAGNAARKYPARPSPSTQAQAPSATKPNPSPQTAPTQSSPAISPSAESGSVRAKAINLDASDPFYASNLHKLGMVSPQTSFSHPSDPPKPASQSQTPSQPRYNNTSPISSSPTAHNPDFYAPPTHNPASSQPFRDQYALNPSSNPALLILKARQELQDKADKEIDMWGRRGFEGKEFVDVHLIREALILRRKGWESVDIEKRLGLRQGVLGKLGRQGIVDAV